MPCRSPFSTIKVSSTYWSTAQGSPEQIGCVILSVFALSPILCRVPSSMVCLLLLQPLSSWLPMVMASMLPGSPSGLHGKQPPLGPSTSQIKVLPPHRSFVHHVSFPGWCPLFLLLSSSSMTEAVAPPWLGCLSHLHYFYVGSTF